MSTTTSKEGNRSERPHHWASVNPDTCLPCTGAERTGSLAQTTRGARNLTISLTAPVKNLCESSWLRMLHQ